MVISVQTGMTILFFYTVDCNACIGML